MAALERHHVVPRFLLQRFADDHGQLKAVDRADPSKMHLTPAWKACREAGFYRIEADDLEPLAREGHDPDLAEKALSGIESNSAEIIDRLANSLLPTSDTERLHLALFVALLVTRGWQFRDEINEIGTLRMRQEVTSSSQLAAKARRWLSDEGRPHGEAEVKEYLDLVVGAKGPRLAVNHAHRIQESLRHAMETLTPMLMRRDLKLLVFDEPSLVISDAPVAAWAPGETRAVGVGNAALVCLPISRHAAIAYGSPVRSAVVTGSQRRAKQINLLVADGAARWIYQHPDDRIVETLSVPAQRPHWVEEFVARRVEPDGTIRERWQHVRR